MLTFTERMAQKMANDLLPHGSHTGTLYGTVAFLFTAQPPMSPQMTLADFTIADFSGYEPLPVTWDGPFNVGNSGQQNLIGSSCTWESDDTVTANTVTGWGLLDGSDTTKLLAAEVFEDSVDFVNPGDGLVLIPKFLTAVPNAGDYGQIVS